MTDEAFIDQTLKSGKQARDKAGQFFSPLSLNQLNWKSSPGRWSIAQCLEHLHISDSAYFADLHRITTGHHKMTFWEKYSPLTATFGKLLKDQLQEKVKKKMTAPKKLTPPSQEKNVDFINSYLQNLDVFLKYISDCRHADLDKTIITSPTLKFVTYNLRDAFQFLIQHEHRHINQAIRVKNEVDFPRK